MKRKSFPRPRIQRAFVRWLNMNQSRFKVPVRITMISAKGIELHFPNLPSCLSAWLSSNEFRVCVNWQGTYWDSLTDMDAYPFRTAGGWKCKLCAYENAESAVLFPNREALWENHFFEPFLNWVNEKLAPARWMRISSTDGATWAELIRDESALSEPDRTLLLMQQLKRLDGQPVYDDGAEGVSNRLIPLRH